MQETLDTIDAHGILSTHSFYLLMVKSVTESTAHSPPESSQKWQLAARSSECAPANAPSRTLLG